MPGTPVIMNQAPNLGGILALAFSRNESETTASITSQHRHPVARLVSLRNTVYMLSSFKTKTRMSRSPRTISALRRTIHISILAAATFCSAFIFAAPALAVKSLAAQASLVQQAAQAIAPDNSSAATAPITQYTLSPEKTRQAQALARTGRRFYFAEFFWGLLILWFSLRTGWAAKIRDWATRASSNTYHQAAIFCPLLVLTLDVLALPLHAWAHGVLRGYGLSVQGWSSWLLDWMKSEAITLVLATFVGWILFLLIRRSPRRWWIGAWVGAVLLIVIGVYIEPLVIEPLFYDFRPLSESHPQLVRDVEQTIARAGITIPENRILEMNASQKLNETNAYVTGIGNAKRVVFWDTLLSRTNEPQALSVFGHELGHYALGHVWKGIILSAIGLAFALPLLAWLFNGTLRKWESIWYVRQPQDWTALAVLLLLILILQFVATPINNAASRYIEHQADVYGLEVIHGIVPNSQQVAAQTDQILGESNLEDPNPSPYVVFWFYTHPPIAERLKFSLNYDPWSTGGTPEFIH
jgi:STE24 endopeptidase